MIRVVFGQDKFVKLVKAERSGIEIDHKDIVEDRFENRDKGFMVGVGEVVRSGRFIFEGDDEAMSESFVKPFRAVVDSPFQRTNAGNFAFQSGEFPFDFFDLGRIGIFFEFETHDVPNTLFR